MSGKDLLLLGSTYGVAQYKIERSLRFNSADSAYLNRTLGTPTNNLRWSISFWMKRSALDGRVIFGSNVAPSFIVYFDTSNRVDVRIAGFQYFLTTPVYRDTSAWYHFQLVFDSANATQADRIILYINGVRQAASVQSCPLNQNSGFNASSAQSNLGFINNWFADARDYFNGYMTEVNFIDGQALTPSSFGETDADTGVWKPKAYSGSYGTNGFYLKFADNSGTTSTTLGKDSSGNSNNWTPNNFSVTAGAGNDSLVDSPTQYGTDTGAGGEVRGNYATWNPLKKNTAITYANGNLDASGTTGFTYPSFGSIVMSTGKWYWENTVNSNDSGGFPQFGAVDLSVNENTNAGMAASKGIAYTQAGNIIKDGSTILSSRPTFTNGDVISVAFDADTGKIWFAKNGTWVNGSSGSAGNPAAGTNEVGSVSTAIQGYVTGGSAYNSASFSANFGQRPFAYTAPSGFKALCTTNLPTPTIGATSTTQASDYFNVVARTFTAASATITGLGFSPDFLWFKRRNVAASHSLYDSVRGTNARLLSNGSNAEITTTSAELTSFDSDGFTVGSDPGSISINAANGDTGVVWCWRGSDSAPVTNNSGTIQSTVSANTTSGFSIVTYVGTGTAGTIGHGLGATPSMIIVKRRSSGTAQSWQVFHSGISGMKDGYIYLNLTNAFTSGYSAIWNGTNPTSTVFSVGNDNDTNANGGLGYVAYCFAPVAGYSAFGSYTGNGSTDGPFIYTGFRPKYVLIKSSSVATSWYCFDTSRNTYNESKLVLFPNLSDSEYTNPYGIDILSNGFKVRALDGYGLNNSSGTYIYAAFAEFPFKYTLAR